MLRYQKRPDEAIRQNLQELWPRLSSTLVQALEARMRERAAALGKTLADRASKETQHLMAVMEDLGRLIRAEVKQPEVVQMGLWSEFEKEQLRRVRDGLQARLSVIPQELEKEKQAIPSRFADPPPRMFTVAATYLVPEKLARGR